MFYLFLIISFLNLSQAYAGIKYKCTLDDYSTDTFQQKKLVASDSTQPENEKYHLLADNIHEIYITAYKGSISLTTNPNHADMKTVDIYPGESTEIFSGLAIILCKP